MLMALLTFHICTILYHPFQTNRWYESFPYKFCATTGFAKICCIDITEYQLSMKSFNILTRLDNEIIKYYKPVGVLVTFLDP